MGGVAVEQNEALIDEYLRGEPCSSNAKADVQAVGVEVGEDVVIELEARPASHSRRERRGAEH